MTTDFADYTEVLELDSIIRAIRVIRGSNLRTQNRLVGRKSDDHRTQNAARYNRPKLCHLIDLRSNIKNFGRIGRKFPEHFVVASGQ